MSVGKAFEPRAQTKRRAAIPLVDRSGNQTGDSVTEADVKLLIERQLVEQVGRRFVTAIRPRPGVPIAAITAALREGHLDRFPIAEDCTTVRRVRVPGGGVYHEPIRIEAWDDGRAAVTLYDEWRRPLPMMLTRWQAHGLIEARLALFVGEGAEMRCCLRAGTTLVACRRRAAALAAAGCKRRSLKGL